MKTGPFRLTHHVGAKRRSRFIGTLLLTLLFASAAGAGWVRQTSNTTLKLMDVCFVDSLCGWGVGGWSSPNPSDTSRGICLRTSDGGNSWTMVYDTSGRSMMLSVSFVNRSRGWMMGDSSLSLVTTDGGLTWQNLPQISFWFVPFAQRFVNDTLGYVVGGTPLGGMLDGTAIYRTADGGASWVAVVPYKRGQWLLGLDIRASNWVWTAGGYGTLYRTTNAGGSWQGYAFPAQSRWYYGVAFGDTSYGVAVGYNGYILGTSDGGRSWVQRPSPTNQGLYGAEMPDSQHAWACGTGGTIITSTDGGMTWASQVSGTSLTLRRIWFTDDLKGWAVVIAG